MKKICLIFLVVFLTCGIAFSQILLDDTWADGTRDDTSLPYESAVWAGHPGDVTVSPGSLKYGSAGYTSSHKLWTYFTEDGSPETIGIGEKLVATIDFIPRGLYVSDAENFRFGLFHDPTDPQVWEDLNDDGGGDGDPWMDSTGYAVRTTLSSGAGDNPQIGKRTDMTNSSLLGSSDAYAWDSGGDDVEYMINDALYTAMLELYRTAADQMEVTFSLSDEVGIITQHTLIDTSSIYTNFDHLFFRFSSASGTADIIDFQNFNVHMIPEPSIVCLLYLGGLVLIKKRKFR